ncbi:hypothetical protein FHG87_004611 [Trinorchestia longiramus]|nr:hypothetical protein FHG87_004611 [Trinorchestia longiramus]
MASSSSEKCRGGLLSCVCWLLGASLKVSTLVVLLALLATVHQLRSTAEDGSLKLEIAERELADATSQKDDAVRGYKEMASQLNQLQTDLANSRRETQELQVQLSKKQDLQKDLDRKTQEANSANREILVLTQKIQELEAEARRKEQEEKNQHTSSVVQTLEGEKQQLQAKVASFEALLEQKKSAEEFASEKLKSLTQNLQQTEAKLAEAEKLQKMHASKEKEQEKKIEMLQEQIKKLEDAKKAVDARVLQLTAERDHALHDLDAARVKAAQVEKDSEAKAVELQRTLVEREQITKKFATTEKEYNELKTLKEGLEKQLAEAHELRSAALKDASHAKEILLNERDALLMERNMEKEEMKETERLIMAEIHSRDERIKQLSAEGDVLREKWTKCDSVAEEKLSQLQVALGECQTSRDSMVPAEQEQQKLDLSHVTREKATLVQQCEHEHVLCKKEKKHLESIMQDMFQQFDRKDSRIKELEEKAASDQHQLIEVENALTEKVATLQSELRGCLVADAETCSGPEGEESCRDRADCSKLKLRVMELEASLKNSKEQQQKLTATVEKTREDWIKANEHADEMRQKAKEAEQLAHGREEMVEFMREQVMRSAEITHGDLVQELRALAKNHDELLRKYNEEVKPLEEKLNKAKKGWLQNDKELVELKKELAREKLRVSLCAGNGGQK